MVKVLVDTCVIIDYLRTPNKEKTHYYRLFSEEKNHAAISLVTVTELWAGKSISSKKALSYVNKVLNRTNVIVPDIKTAKLAGTIIRELMHNNSLADAYIAATAIQHKLPLLTLHKKDFQNIPGLKLYDY